MYPRYRTTLSLHWVNGIDNCGAYVSPANSSDSWRDIRGGNDGGEARGYRGTRRARTRRPERRRSHRVKWKPVYARLSSRVNPDHSSIVPQTGNPRPFQPFRTPVPSPPFSRLLSDWQTSFTSRKNTPFARDWNRWSYARVSHRCPTSRSIITAREWCAGNFRGNRHGEKERRRTKDVAKVYQVRGSKHFSYSSETRPISLPACSYSALHRRSAVH